MVGINFLLRYGKSSPRNTGCSSMNITFLELFSKVPIIYFFISLSILEDIGGGPHCQAVFRNNKDSDNCRVLLKNRILVRGQGM